MARYVDTNDLAYLITLIRDDFVKKEEGKGLSSNDFTNDYKELLDSIFEGGISVSGDKSKTFKQDIASNVWEINHGLNKYPAVSIVDSAGNQVVGDIMYVNLNTVKVVFSSSFSGKAYLN